MSGMGTVVWDEVVCHVERLHFEGGKLWIRAVSDRIDGIRDVPTKSASFAIFGPDGRQVFAAVAAWAPSNDVEQVVDGRVHVVLPIELEMLT